MRISELKLFLFQFLIISFGCIPFFAQAQTLDHVLGEILVKVEDPNHIESIIRSVQPNLKKEANLRQIRQLNTPFPIFKLGFDQNQTNEFRLLERLQAHPLVEEAQFNHLVSSRLLPNDPFFSLQWHIRNDGSAGGTINADLDLDLIWNFTTGGITSLGDTIVICIIDEGIDTEHSDLRNNLYKNFEEIPNNGIDDDMNGYVDDYLGWNVFTENDQISTNIAGNVHGTPVAGLIGAEGNNQIGVTGINWNIKLMMVIRGDTEETILEAYTYPYVQRKRYNESAGAKGAFIVAANTSWGVNFGQPSEAPLWCSFYDSLGMVGIVSPAATINSNQNVDIVGDLPTACESEFMISVSSIDFNNNKVNNSGFGATTIDLAAYGENVATTSDGNGYSFFNGTSLTAPQVSGTIGLLYSGCASLAALAKTNPQSAATQVKDIILNSTKPNPDLEGITTTGGQLNIKDSFLELFNVCDFSGCYGPNNVQIKNVDNNSATVSWVLDTTNVSIMMRYRQKGSSNWTMMTPSDSNFVLTNLLSCVSYEFQLRPDCENGQGIFSVSYEFRTLGCCIPPTVLAINTVNNVTQIEWSDISAAAGYTFQYRPQGSTDWEQASVATNTGFILNLESCLTYELRVQTNCINGFDTAFSEIQEFSTENCGSCLELDYCIAGPSLAGNTWIKKVKLGNIDHESANENEGYSNFTEFSTDLILGYFEIIEIQTDFNFFSSNSFFRVWIDYNQDGDFEDDNELIYSPAIPSLEKLSFIIIPNDAIEGSTRMRVSAREEQYSPCSTDGLTGEVEDYCVNITSSDACLSPGNIQISSLEDEVNINWIGSNNFQSYRLRYRPLGAQVWQFDTVSAFNITLSDLLPCADYELQIQNTCSFDISDFTSLNYFTTKGCGPCLDQAYCIPKAPVATFEWIENVSFNTLSNTSGSNEGYTRFSDFTTQVVRGNTYPITLTPGFATASFEEYFQVWIDYNQNGMFEDSELVFDPGMPGSVAITGNITIPVDVLLGSTRMRVSMKYVNPALPCEGSFDGETEDYCIDIAPSETIVCQVPEDYNSFIDETSFNVEVQWTDISEKKIHHFRYREKDSQLPWTLNFVNSNYIQLFDLPECKDFEYQIRTVCENGLSEYSSLNYFQSFCLATSISIQESSNDIKVFPNPFLDVLHIHLDDPSDSILQIEIFDISGKLIFAQSFSDKERQKEIRPPLQIQGIHILKIKSEKGTWAKRIVQ